MNGALDQESRVFPLVNFVKVNDLVVPVLARDVAAVFTDGVAPPPVVHHNTVLHRAETRVEMIYID